MRRPFGLMFALLALWLQTLAPAVAARAMADPAFDPTAIVCDHLGQTNAPQPAPAPDEHHGSCCLADHVGAADVAAPQVGIVGTLRRSRTIARRLGDDPHIGGASRADLHARGPPPSL